MQNIDDEERKVCVPRRRLNMLEPGGDRNEEWSGMKIKAARVDKEDKKEVLGEKKQARKKRSKLEVAASDPSQGGHPQGVTNEGG